MTDKADASRARTIISIVLAAAAWVLGLALGVIGSFVVPSFAQVFDSFGTDLPALTALLVNAPYVLWTPFVLNIPALLLWWPLRSSTARIVCYLILVVADVILIPLIIVVLYLPIYKLGQVM